MDILNIKDWGIGLENLNKPLLIAGPCSAETEEQTILSCQGVAAQGVHLLRAGIWKPRTRPNSFEGMGVTALPWLKTAGRLTGLPVSTEIANAEHVEQALKYGIDVLWIGARTTVNPFAVQEIADALRGVDIPVMVKNPINPDLELWIGGLERLYQAGIVKLAAIHRGFSQYGLKKYRNAPMWELPIDLHRRVPGLEIINDPSHICGVRHLIPDVAQTALDLGFDGLMIESHINPAVALSDAKQQFTPEDLGVVLRNLNPRHLRADNPLYQVSLDNLRLQIDALDHELVELLARRMSVSREIGDLKREHNLTLLDIERWRSIFRDRAKHILSLGLSEDLAQAILQAIHKESLLQQTIVSTEKVISDKL